MTVTQERSLERPGSGEHGKELLELTKGGRLLMGFRKRKVLHGEEGPTVHILTSKQDK